MLFTNVVRRFRRDVPIQSLSTFISTMSPLPLPVPLLSTFTPISNSVNDPVNGHWRRWNAADGAPTPGKEMIYANTQGKNQFIPDLLTQAAMKFIEINQPDPANRYRPFYLVLNYKIPGDGRSQVPTDAPFSEEKWPQPARTKPR